MKSPSSKSPKKLSTSAAVKGLLREKSTGEVHGSIVNCLVVGLELLLAKRVSSWEELDVV